MMIINLIQKICLILLSFCGLRITHGLANIIAIIFFSRKSKKYSVAYKNLSICFPDKPHSWVDNIAYESLKEYIKSILEAPYIWRVSKKQIDVFINKIYAEDIIDNAIKENKGVIFMTPHHGSWELSGLVAASKIKTYTMVKPLRNKILNRFALSGRKAKGSILVETNNAGVKTLLKALKNKNGIGILPDHTPKINQGVMSNFFNVPVNTNTLIHKLSKKNKVPIIYIFSERLSWGRGFNIHVGLVDQLFYDLDEVKAAGLLNKTLEELVMRNITQYQWSYERFRNRSGVKESIYN